MEDSVGMSRRRSPRLLSQIHIHESEDGAEAGVTRRTRRRRGKSPPAPESLPFNDDMLREILLRLPPQPSSLPRASTVSKGLRGLVTDPKFLRSFSHHHRKPPLLGTFHRTDREILFTPVLDPPDRVPPERFSLGRCSSRDDYILLDCRHGLVLVTNFSRTEVVVCDPITGEQRRVDIPLEFRGGFFTGSVLCAAGDQGHVHGGCHSTPFKVVLMSMYDDDTDDNQLACAYSSETGIWSNLIAAEPPCDISGQPAVLVGNCLYWKTDNMVLLPEFDLDENSLTIICGPRVTTSLLYEQGQIIRTEDDALGYGVLEYPHFKTWRRNANGHGVAAWVPWKTIEMHTILGLPFPIQRVWGRLMGYDEDSNVVFLHVDEGVYMVQIKSMQSKKLHEISDTRTRYYPFKSLYTPGTAIDGGFNGAEIVHNQG